MPRLTLTRGIAWSLVAWMSAGAVASCRGVVAGDATNFPEALCQILHDCEGDCPVDLTLRVLEAAPEARGGLLAFDVSHDCLGSCSAARRCRDQPPICRSTGEACAQASDCCRFTAGASACSGGDAGACCLSLGARCDPDAEDPACCNGEICAQNERCGGVECTLTVDEVSDPADAACDSSFDCCSRRCEGGACVPNACSQLGQKCHVDLDCCSSVDANGGVVQPACDPSARVCVDSTAACDVCLPVQDPALNCCLEAGETCYVLGDGTTQCGPPGCAPDGGDCASNDDCCQGADEPTYCNTTLVPHCDAAPTCSIAGKVCSSDIECCAGSCLGGQCSVPQDCEPVVDHSPCNLGAPLPKSLDPAVTTVCDQQPACCCQAWGAACRETYRLNEVGACPLL